MSRRTPETLADYLVVAICPILIGLLVGSLMFFLVHVFYQGEFQARLLLVMAMFVMAIVCITRIAMEEGQAYATLYALPIAVLVGIALAKFVQIQGPLAPFSGPINWLLMAVVWAAAHRLTWDCTLVDDSQDASGEGLLQQMGLESSPHAPREEPVSRSETTTDEATSSVQPAAPARSLAWWQSWLEPDRRPHTPGVWVVIFSLAALPLFGIGGRFIASGDLDLRRRCFWLLIVYVASGMALLLATSFLNLRRYLRQRRLEMPLEMAAAWIGAGLVLIVATLLVASLVPRPSPEYSLAQLVDIDSLDRKASRYAFGPEGGKDNPDNPSQSGADKQEGQEAEKTGGDKSDGKQGTGDGEKGKKGGGKGKGKSSKSPSESKQETQGESSSGEEGDKSKGESDKGEPSENDSSQEKSDGKSGDKQADSQSGDKGQEGEKSSSQQSPANKASSGQPPQLLRHVERLFGSLGGVLKAIFYLAIAVIAAIAAWRYRAEIAAAWRKLLAELQALWAGWFGTKAPAASEEPRQSTPGPLPFSHYSNPFTSGQSSRMSPAELVRYTFVALETWGRENGCPRAEGQTPHEFAAAIGQLDHTLSREAAHLADLYARLAYAPPAAIRTTFEPLRALWQKMQSPTVVVV